MQNIQSVAIYVIGLFLVLFIARILSKPFKILLRLALNILIGGIVLIVINTLGGSYGIALGVNPVTAAVVGIFGLPGLALLFVLKFIFGG